MACHKAPTLVWVLAWNPTLMQGQRGMIWGLTARGLALPHSHSGSLSTFPSLSGLHSLISQVSQLEDQDSPALPTTALGPCHASPLTCASSSMM